MALARIPGYQGLTPFYAAMLEGVEDTLEAAGGRLVVHLVGDVDEAVATYRRWAQAGTVAGVLLNDLEAGDTRAAICGELGLEVVCLGEANGPDSTTTVVDVDNGAAMTAALDYLVGLGHRHIARVSGPAVLGHSLMRSAAWDEYLAEVGVVGRTVVGDYSAAVGAELTRELLEGGEVTAIAYDNDVMAVAGLEAARDAGRSVPADLSLLAWDDSPECQLAEPALSVVSRDLWQLGEVVAGALLAPEPARVVPTPPAVLVARGSTAPPRRDRRDRP